VNYLGNKLSVPAQRIVDAAIAAGHCTNFVAALKRRASSFRYTVAAQSTPPNPIRQQSPIAIIT